MESHDKMDVAEIQSPFLSHHHTGVILLMVQKSQTTTWDGHKTLKIMGIFTISTGDPRISEPSTVFSASFGIIFRDGGDKKGTK